LRGVLVSPSAPPAGGLGQRFRAVREAHRRADGSPLPQADFARLLAEAARRLFQGKVERVYNQSVVNRLEGENQKPTPQDIAVYAHVDPQGRGKLWLAWGEQVDATLRTETASVDPLSGIEQRQRRPGSELREEKPAAKKPSRRPRAS
jgi:hypothetical protein